MTPIEHCVLANPPSICRGQIAYSLRHLPGYPLLLHPCPGAGPGTLCDVPPLDPDLFSRAHEHESLEKQMARLPTWIYDWQGTVVGTRTRPWRSCDYVVEIMRRRLGLQPEPQSETFEQTRHRFWRCRNVAREPVQSTDAGQLATHGDFCLTSEQTLLEDEEDPVVGYDSEGQMQTDGQWLFPVT
ncbi:hypothetical protein B0A49_03142 [Cryomyces minteri]|uniref:Uncharacterized protein n=1 Tax=Cryomyces minteri TaxID=331657 RepID=A0A4V5NHM1_9PEZI|nr:hypothetical protein B0A49_03142 [Cryomyces minteri]